MNLENASKVLELYRGNGAGTLYLQLKVVCSSENGWIMTTEVTQGDREIANEQSNDDSPLSLAVTLVVCVL